jgi:hypothetical protein
MGESWQMPAKIIPHDGIINPPDEKPAAQASIEGIAWQ